MEKPKILCANIAGCAFFAGKQAAVYASVAEVVKVGGLPAAAMVCQAPVAGVVYCGGFAA